MVRNAYQGIGGEYDTPDFIKEFAVYLATEAGLRNGTIWEKCMWLKGVVMRAHFNGLIPSRTSMPRSYR